MLHSKGGSLNEIKLRLALRESEKDQLDKNQANKNERLLNLAEKIKKTKARRLDWNNGKMLSPRSKRAQICSLMLDGVTSIANVNHKIYELRDDLNGIVL